MNKNRTLHKRWMAAVLVVTTLAWTVAPFSRLPAQPLPELTPPPTDPGGLSSLGGRAAVSSSIRDWEAIVREGRIVLAAEWEAAVDAEIDGYLASVSASDAVHDVDAYRDYLRAELDVQKGSAFAAWELEADAYFAAERAAFLNDLAAQQEQSAGDDAQAALTEAEREERRAQDETSLSLTEDELIELRRAWEERFRADASAGLGEFADALNALDADYQSTLAELERQAALFEENLSVMQQLEQDVRNSIAATVDQMEVFLNSSGLFHEESCDSDNHCDVDGSTLNAAGQDLAQLIGDVRGALADGDPLSAVAANILSYMETRRTEAEATSQVWADRVNVDAAQSYYKAAGDPNVMPWEYQEAYTIVEDLKGNRQPLLDFLRSLGGYGDHLDIAISSTYAAGWSPSYPPLSSDAGTNVFSYSDAGIYFRQIGETRDQRYSAFMHTVFGCFGITRYNRLDPCGDPSYPVSYYLVPEQFIQFEVTYVLTDNNARANADTWQGYVDDLNPVITQWQDDLLPALQTWEAQSSSYAANYSAWQAEADAVRSQATAEYAQRRSEITAQRDAWFEDTRRDFLHASARWDDVEDRRAAKALALEDSDAGLPQELAQLVTAAQSANVQRVKISSDATGLREHADSLATEPGSNLPDMSLLKDAAGSLNTSLNGLLNFTYARTVADEAEQLRDQLIDQAYSILSRDYVQNERQEVEYNPYEDVPVLLRPAGWENASATRLETDEEMQQRLERQARMNFSVKILDDGTVVAHRSVDTGQVAWNGGDLTSTTGYDSVQREQIVRIAPPEALKLVSGGDLFEQWDFGAVQAEREAVKQAFYDGAANWLSAAQARMNTAHASKQLGEKLSSQAKQDQAQLFSMLKSLMTSMAGGMSAGDAFIDYAKNQIMGDIAAHWETMTGIPAGFVSALLGGASVEEAMQGYAWQVVGSEIDRITGIKGFGSLLTGELKKKMAAKAARNGPTGKLANSMASMTMGGGLGAMAGLALGPIGMLAGAAMGGLVGAASNDMFGPGIAQPLADTFYDNPMLMDATAFSASMMTNNPGLWYGYQAQKGYYEGGELGSVARMADTALMATQLVGIDASVSYTHADGFGASIGVGGDYGSVGISYSDKNGAGAYGRLGQGDGLSIGFNVSERGGNSINAGYSSGGVKVGLSYNDETGFGVNLGYGLDAGGVGTGQLGLGWNENAGLTGALTFEGENDVGNVNGALTYNERAGFGAQMDFSTGGEGVHDLLTGDGKIRWDETNGLSASFDGAGYTAGYDAQDGWSGGFQQKVGDLSFGYDSKDGWGANLSGKKEDLFDYNDRDGLSSPYLDKVAEDLEQRADEFRQLGDLGKQIDELEDLFKNPGDHVDLDPFGDEPFGSVPDDVAGVWDDWFGNGDSDGGATDGGYNPGDIVVEPPEGGEVAGGGSPVTERGSENYKQQLRETYEVTPDNLANIERVMQECRSQSGAGSEALLAQMACYDRIFDESEVGIAHFDIYRAAGASQSNQVSPGKDTYEPEFYKYIQDVAYSEEHTDRYLSGGVMPFGSFVDLIQKKERDIARARQEGREPEPALLEYVRDAREDLAAELCRAKVGCLLSKDEIQDTALEDYERLLNDAGLSDTLFTWRVEASINGDNGKPREFDAVVTDFLHESAVGRNILKYQQHFQTMQTERIALQRQLREALKAEAEENIAVDDRLAGYENSRQSEREQGLVDEYLEYAVEVGRSILKAITDAPGELAERVREFRDELTNFLNDPLDSEKFFSFMKSTSDLGGDPILGTLINLNPAIGQVLGRFVGVADLVTGTREGDPFTAVMGAWSMASGTRIGNYLEGAAAKGVGAVAGKIVEKGRAKLDKIGVLPCKSCSSCLISGTPILTPDGQRKIDDLEVGDSVIAYDTATGSPREQKVTHVFRDITLVWYEIRVGEDTLTVTDNHPFWMEERGVWVAAKDLTVGDRLRPIDGELAAIQSIKARQLERSEPIYNIEVAGDHNYFAGDAAWLVHNQNSSSSSGCIRCLASGINITLKKLRGTVSDAGWQGNGHYKNVYKIEGQPGKVLGVVKNPLYLAEDDALRLIGEEIANLKKLRNHVEGMKNIEVVNFEAVARSTPCPTSIPAKTCYGYVMDYVDPATHLKFSKHSLKEFFEDSAKLPTPEAREKFLESLKDLRDSFDKEGLTVQDLQGFYDEKQRKFILSDPLEMAAGFEPGKSGNVISINAFLDEMGFPR